MSVDKREQYLEVFLEPVIIASTYMGDDGRPLAEMTAPRSKKEGIPFEMRRCPYAGSRRDKPMNVSALRVLSLGMKQTISDTIELRSAYLRHIERESFDLVSFWRFTRVLDSMPAYLVRRAEGALDPGNLPSRVATMFKAAQGLHLAPEVMLLGGARSDTPISTGALLELIEARGLFLDDGRACAGPPPMVEAFVEGAVRGQGHDLGDGWMFELLGEPEARGLFAYADAVSDVFVAKVLHEVGSRLLVARAVEGLEDRALSRRATDAGKRFGFFVTATLQGLQAARDALLAIAPGNPMGAVPTRSASADDSLPSDLERILRHANPQFAPEFMDQALGALWEGVRLDARTLFRLEGLQRAVLRSLGRPIAVAALTSRDFPGGGYSAREVLASWLGTQIIHDQVTLIAQVGASKVRCGVDLSASPPPLA